MQSMQKNTTVSTQPVADGNSIMFEINAYKFVVSSFGPSLPIIICHLVNRAEWHQSNDEFIDLSRRSITANVIRLMCTV